MQSELVERLEAEISELKQDKANLENEIDDINYQLKTEISDLKRANKTLRDEVINLQAIDVTLVDDCCRPEVQGWFRDFANNNFTNNNLSTWRPLFEHV